MKFTSLAPNGPVLLTQRVHGDEHCLRFDDPAPGIVWPLPVRQLFISDKDKQRLSCEDSPKYT